MEEQTEHKKSKKEEEFSGSTIWIIAIAAVLILFNQIQLFQLNSMLGLPAIGSFGGGSFSLSGGEGVTYAPVLLAPGESPVLSSYGTKVKQLPTISSSPEKEKTGDAAQDALNMLIPTGTPEYGQEAGVSFDDPITAQRTWGNYERSIQLNAEQQKRYDKIVGSFTCDYCCGSPQNPTIITHCGCAHARAWRGMAKFFIQKYGDQVTDEQIMGELSRWKALWYPGPTVQRVLQEQSLSGGESSAPVKLDELPQMVGGC
ncbi:MAG TPA: hypothetical protein VI612_04985 [Candidatus Nanoarchaeia archaeon]|nr:hypothetical protein [Candidatus Nanoarchaeia archaeon]